MKITIETEFDENLKDEFSQWEQASDEDFVKFEKSLEAGFPK